MKNNRMFFDCCQPQCPINAICNRTVVLIQFIEFTLFTALRGKSLTSLLLLGSSPFIMSLLYSSAAKIS